MSLREAVSAIADAMEQEAIAYSKSPDGGVPHVVVRSYVGQLRIALKASEHESVANPPPALMAELFGIDPKRQAGREAREQALRAKKEADLREDQYAPFETAEIAEALDPGMIGDVIPVGGVPVNAYVPVGGSVYQLRRDGRLYYSEQKTKEWREPQARRQG